MQEVSGSQKTLLGMSIGSKYNNWGLKEDVREFPFTTLSTWLSLSLSRPNFRCENLGRSSAILGKSHWDSFHFLVWKKMDENWLVGCFLGALKNKPPLKELTMGFFSLQEVTLQGIWLCSFPPFQNPFNLENNSQRIVGGQAMVIPITLDPWKERYLPALIP